MGDTAISWTHRPGTRGRTWNPVRGCSRTIAAGAKQSGCGDGTGGGCYAERTAGRFCGPGKPYEGLVRITAKGARWTGVVRLVMDHIRDPLHWREPSTVFTNSMSDLFHENLPDSSIDYVVAVMMICALREDGPDHTFQTLTKRAARMRSYFNDPTTQERVARRAGSMMEDGDGWFDLIAFRKEGLVHPSMWWGVSVENQAAADERIPELLATPAAVRFLSCEPLIGPVDLAQWIGDCDVRQDQESGGVRVRGGDVGRIGDRQRREDMEGSGSARKSMGMSTEVGPVQAGHRRSNRNDGVPDSSGNARREEDDGAVASPDLVPSLRSDPRRYDREPQERSQARQQAREPGTRHGQRADDSCSQSPETREGCTPARGVEPIREAHISAGNRDPSSQSERRAAGHDRGALRRDVPAHLGGSPRPQSLHWIICGCESGPGARSCDSAWLRSLRDQCASAGVPYFLKQATEIGDDGPDEDPREVGYSGGYRRPVTVLCGPGSKRKSGGVIELPYLDGVQHAAFPEVSHG